MPAKPIDIAIIGAGPYGLSLAAHLHRTRQSFRIFGEPMRSWSHHMPSGMSLKSEGFASDLYDPDHKFTLKAYCAESGIPYADIALPVRLENFIAYGLEFQRRFVPSVDTSQVTALVRRPSGFELTTSAGEAVLARQAVVAVGIIQFARRPAILASISTELASHSCEHSDLARFRGRKIAVLGAGASAFDIAVLLRQSGVDAELIARASTIQFHDPPIEPRSLFQKLKAPRSGLGTGWRSRMCTDMPLVFYALPQSLRHRAVERHLGPAPCWFTREAVENGLPTHLGVTLAGAEERNGRVQLKLSKPGQMDAQLEFDHVISATGYRVDLSRLSFLDRDLQSQILQASASPILNRHFESSVAGLFFVGITAANSFGPLLRFAYGAKFAARRLATHLANT